MLQELRESISPPMTRTHLAEILNRSPNYILKAESLTFPAVPPSLLDFYTNRLDYPRPLLVSQYRAAQSHRRRWWLYKWQPSQVDQVDQVVVGDQQTQPLATGAHINAGQGLSEVGEKLNWPNQLSFCSNWEHQTTGIQPTQYAVSQGLCIPAAAVYAFEKDPTRLPKSFIPALEDLVEYCSSGQCLADTHLTEDQILRTLDLLESFLKL